MALTKLALLRNPRAVYLTHWIFALSDSLVALVMRCLMFEHPGGLDDGLEPAA